MPEVARGVFGSRLEVAAAYADLLATDAVTRGLIGPREAPRVWERHLVNCAVLGEAVPQGIDVCDVGSGAGLPGLVLAIGRPDLSVTLLEPLLRRTTFLDEAVERLGLTNVTVLRGRAEEQHGRLDFGVVTSRAVAPLPRLLEWSAPLVRPGGLLLAVKGAGADEELAQVRDVLLRRGAVGADVLHLGADVIDPPTTVIRIESGDAAPLDWTRAGDTRPRSGQQRKGRRRDRGRGSSS